MPKFCGMNYKIYGEGKPVLLLHGWGASIDAFAPIINELSNDYKIFAIDFWGFGKSDKPSPNFGLLDYVACIARFCEEIIKRPCIVIGHSFGGRVGITLSAMLPKNVQKLILVDSAGLRPKFNIKKFILVKKYKRVKSKVKLGIIPKSALEKFGSNDYKSLDDDMRKVFVNVVNLDLTEYAKKIDVPTLLFWGKKDKETPLYMAKRLKRLIKNSKLVVVKGGHYSYLDNTQAFIRECYNFI